MYSAFLFIIILNKSAKPQKAALSVKSEKQATL
jgi:hypothetical protein